MHTLRYNPSTLRWGLYGPPLPERLEVLNAHLVDKDPSVFTAAVHPANPFVLASDEGEVAHHNELMRAERPAVGEYELLLYKGKVPFAQWGVAEWEGWLGLVQQRLLALQHNPHLGWLQVALDTGLLDTVAGYQRVGELIGCSVSLGENAHLTEETLHRLYDHEQLFRVMENQVATVQVPSAPTFAREIWYLPRQAVLGFEEVHGAARSDLAEQLHALYQREYQGHRMQLRIYTYPAEYDLTYSWWVQLFTGDEPVLPIHPRPEGLVHRLRQESATVRR